MQVQPLSIGGVEFGAGDIQSSEPGFDAMQMPVVNLRFTRAGAEKLHRAMRGTGVGKAMSIRVNGKELSAPILREMRIRDSVTISGSFTLAEAKDIAAAIAAAVAGQQVTR